MPPGLRRWPGCRRDSLIGMTDPADWLRQIDAAQERLLDTARQVTDEQARRPSLLPGWTVGHVLTHIARNADSLVNLATWARTGVKTPQYRSDQARDADIQAGANRPAAELLEDVAESNKRISAALADVPADRWDYVVQWRGGAMKPAGVIPSARLTEVEIHHADMGLGYSFGDIPEDFRLRLLRDAAGGLPEDVAVQATDVDLTLPDGRDAATVVTGTSGDLLGWATGRTSGDGLDSPGGLPDVPEWR
jgi:maleylpyruvate isomerase